MAQAPRHHGLPDVRRSHAGPWFQFRAPADLVWLDAELPIAGLPVALDGLRIFHLSDLHLRPAWGKAYDKLGQRLAAEAPDLIVFTGDFVDDKCDHRPALPILRRLIPLLKSRLGTYAIMGNHDVDVLIPYLVDKGVHVLEGKRIVLNDRDAAIEIIGLPGLARGDVDPTWLLQLPPKPDNALRITLAHYPDLLPRSAMLRSDLFLAGHTHGGQICLPGGKPIITHDSLPKRMSAGIHRVNGTWLSVSRGLGFAGIPVRVFCPAEATMIRVTRST